MINLDGKVNNAGELILSGLNTATDAILNIFKVIPAVYRDIHHPTIISSTEARSIAHDSKKLIVIMASMGISGLVELEKYLSPSGDRSSYHFSHFTLDEKIVGTQKKLILSVKPEDIQKIKAAVHEQEVVTGCPALAIDGPSGQNIVHEFYDWLYAIADQHYFPFLDELKKRSGR
jgi:pyrroline-5-carboxylate reductase